jgi:hypothetical protein
MSKRGLAGSCGCGRAVRELSPNVCVPTQLAKQPHEPTRSHLLIPPGGQAMVTAVQNQCFLGHLFSLLKRSVLTFIQYSYPTGHSPTAHFIR